MYIRYYASQSTRLYASQPVCCGLVVYAIHPSNLFSYETQTKSDDVIKNGTQHLLGALQHQGRNHKTSTLIPRKLQSHDRSQNQIIISLSSNLRKIKHMCTLHHITECGFAPAV